VRGLSIRPLIATRLSSAIPTGLRYEPTRKWIRAEREGEVIVDSHRAVLIWPPEQVVPRYAFPSGDVRTTDGVHECADADLEGYVVVDWHAADRWLEEDEEIVGHPRDPFHRIDIRQSSRHVAITVEGELLAESHRPTLLFETGLPVRHYLPREDVRMDALEPSDRRTTCAYKGHASYFSAPAAPDIAWTYLDPLTEAQQIRGLVAFFDERTDVTVDGEQQERPRTQWS
jgi:uncharacterized protein (DUF427 family)